MCNDQAVLCGKRHPPVRSEKRFDAVPEQRDAKSPGKSNSPARGSMNSVDQNEFTIALLPGDGIGPEVLDAALVVLSGIERRLPTVSFKYERFSVGAKEFLLSGDPLPAQVFDRFSEFDAILLGAMGLPSVCWPSGVEMTPQLDIRERLDLYCGLRPIYLFHSADSPLRDIPAGSIDLLLVRESTEGLFSSRRNINDMNSDVVEDKMRITRKGSERIIRAAFMQARKRRKHVTLIDKANVLPSMAYFRKIFNDLAQEYPDVTTDSIYVDAAALYLVQRPGAFDVLLAENMFGDILSDLAAGLVGGMGMAPSADLGDHYAVFQPSHGSAPDIAGQGIANPIATILSAAMMLEWLGNDECRRGASLIRAGVQRLFNDPTARTRDMGGKLSTAQMALEVLTAIDTLPGVGRTL
jgi:3-isopropylmalate dehydrogenase